MWFVETWAIGEFNRSAHHRVDFAYFESSSGKTLMGVEPFEAFAGAVVELVRDVVEIIGVVAR